MSVLARKTGTLRGESPRVQIARWSEKGKFPFDPDRLASMRIKAGLSKHALAGLMNTHRNTISYWEGGKRGISARNAYLLCTVLGCLPYDLVDDKVLFHDVNSMPDPKPPPPPAIDEKDERWKYSDGEDPSETWKGAR